MYHDFVLCHEQTVSTWGILSRQSTPSKKLVQFFRRQKATLFSHNFQTKTQTIMSTTEEKEKPIEMEVDDEDSDIEIEGE